MLRDDRLEDARAHLDGLLDHVVEPRGFERREAVCKIGRRGLFARAITDGKRDGLPARGGEAGDKLAVAAVEDQDGIAFRHAQHGGEIVALVPVERDGSALAEIVIEVEPLKLVMRAHAPMSVRDTVRVKRLPMGARQA